MTISEYAALAGIVLALAVLVPFVRGASRKATLDLLREELMVEREARISQERRCVAEVAELRGQLQVLTGQFARIIAHDVLQALRDEGVLPNGRK
jgi:hypothetical protein